MTLSTWQGTTEPVTLSDCLLTVKPIASTYKVYTAQVQKWRDAELAAVELRARSRQIDTDAAAAALDAARNGEPIPTANLDGLSAAIDAAERAVDAHLRLAQEAEQKLLTAIDEHHDELTTAAETHAHNTTRALLDSIGQTLTDHWDTWVQAQHTAAAVELGKPWTEPTRPLRFRYDGHDRDIADLLGDVLRIVQHTDPETAATLTQIRQLRNTADPANYDRARELFTELPSPAWAEVLGVDSV